MNTGAEAVETAIKVARKWGYEVKGVPAGPGHHRRGRGQLPRPHHHDRQLLHRPGRPRPTSARSRRASGSCRTATSPRCATAIDDTTVAVLLEPIQGEAGVRRPARRATCRRCASICDAGRRADGRRRDPVGPRAAPARTFACDHEGVVPDIYVLGKALGGGIVPGVGGRCRPRRARRAHARAARLDLRRQPAGLRGRARGGRAAGDRRVPGARRRARRAPRGTGLRRPASGTGVVAVRGRGLWAGVDIDPALMTGRQVCERLLARGVLAKDTHGSTIRLAPPLVVEPADLDWVVDQIAEVPHPLSRDGRPGPRPGRPRGCRSRTPPDCSRTHRATGQGRRLLRPGRRAPGGRRPRGSSLWSAPAPSADAGRPHGPVRARVRARG